MISITVPGDKTYEIKHLVLDYNGTIGIDGKLIAGVRELFSRLSAKLNIHVITADTFGSVKEELSGAPVSIRVIGKQNQDKEKESFIHSLGGEYCFAVGNGKNDALMLRAAAIGVAIIQEEGASAITISNSDIVVRHIEDALKLLVFTKRLIATLRN